MNASVDSPDEYAEHMGTLKTALQALFPEVELQL